MFPPAQLALPAAIRNYARYRTEPEKWMLGRFICPVVKLTDLSPFVDELFPSGPSFNVSVIGRSGRDNSAFVEALRLDLEDISALRKKHGNRVNVSVLETKLPIDALLGDATRARNLLEKCNTMIEAHGPPELVVYYEVGVGSTWKETIPAVVSVIAAHRELPRERSLPPGFKLRTGGVDSAAFPSPEEVAGVICACRDARVPVKCTAGLHHPIRRHDDGVETKMHGFLNVFGAAVLATAHQLGPDATADILNDENAADFRFDEDRFHCRELSASIAQIETARQEFIISFGSCSFDEPREDLRTLGLM
jgi:hypothetical protein